MDEAEFQKTYRQFHKKSIHRFFRRGCPMEIAEELTQETYQNVWKHRSSLKGPFLPWLIQIEKNIWNNHCRHQHAAKRFAPEIPFDESTDDNPSTQDPLDSLIDRETNARLYEAIEQLPEKAKHVLVLHKFHMLKGSEVAKRLCISGNTVKAHFTYAKKRLRELLDAGRNDEKP